MTLRILQFGTSRFLQAHADLFVHEAREAGQDIGPITIVKTTLGGPRNGRTEAFGHAEGYPVKLKGHLDGRLVERTVMVKSIATALDANHAWPRVRDIFAHQTEIVFSNVGDSGYAVAPEDRAGPPAALRVPASYPAKFLALLLHRYENGAKPLLVLPCELISNNGQVFRTIVTDLAGDWNCGELFLAWLAHSVTICDTLVDRIVSQPIEPVGAVAEPYGLWAIRREPGFTPPFHHANVVYTNDLEPFLRLKLHILNLGHTFLADVWLRDTRDGEETVRKILGVAEIKDRLLNLYEGEIIPGFAARGLGEQAKAYVASTLERFENPFLDHRISDIAQNHAIKIERRLVDFMAWAREGSKSLSFTELEAVVRGK